MHLHQKIDENHNNNFKKLRTHTAEQMATNNHYTFEDLENFKVPASIHCSKLSCQ